MGMPKKKSRVIVVDGRKYRWRLGLPSCIDEDEWMSNPLHVRVANMTFQVDGDRPGRVCQFRLSWTTGMSVTPEAVRTLVRQARGLGWDPDEPGPAMKLRDTVYLQEIPTKMGTVRAVMES